MCKSKYFSSNSKVQPGTIGSSSLVTISKEKDITSDAPKEKENKDDTSALTQVPKPISFKDTIASAFKTLKRKPSDDSGSAALTPNKKPKARDKHTPIVLDEEQFVNIDWSLEVSNLNPCRERAQ